MTIIQKVVSLLKGNSTMSIQDIYESLPEHSKASIRGNINRYISSTESEKKEFDRVERGMYSIIEIVSVKKINDGNVSLNYTASYIMEKSSATFIHKDFVLPESENLKEGTYQRIDDFKSFKDLENKASSLKGVLVNCNAIEMLKHLNSNSFDMILTDPPYKVISGGTGGKNCPKGILSKNDGKIFDFNDVKFSDCLPELYRVLKDNSHAYFFINFLNLQSLMEEVQKAGFKIHNLLVWEKNNVTPNRWFMKNCEYVLFCRKGKAKPINEQSSKTVHQFNSVLKGKIHETEKPIDLLRSYIRNSSNEGDIVLDPFGGSCSTMFAALKENRRCFTMEINNTYFPKILERVRTELA